MRNFEESFLQQHLETNRLKISPTAIDLTPPSFFFSAINGAPAKISANSYGALPANKWFVNLDKTSSSYSF